MTAFSNNSRNSRGRSNGGSSRRKPRIDSSRRPKPFRPKSGGSKELRAAANSVFADAPNGLRKKTSDVRSENDDFVESGHRLQKVLAAAGFGSRRQCEELIQEGRVEIDGEVVVELGVRVSPNVQKIRVDGEALPKTKPTYIALNKPKNALCTNRDPQGRRRVGDFIPDQFGRLFPVGRLDQNSEGLILLTNDGALAERLTHPRFEVPKKYRVQVAGLVDFNLVRDLKRGVHIAEGIVQADDVVIKSQHKLSSVLEITLKEGKNREIRRMLARLGHKVMQLQRVQVGPIKLGKMAPGDYRRLTSQEVADLYRAAQTPNSQRLDDDERSGSRRLAPVEISEIVRRQEAEEEERAAKNAPKGTKKSAAAQKFAGKKGGVKEGSKFASKRGDASGDRSSRLESRSRREERPEFREEFRSEERREDRRRVRREYDDETRTIGPRKFERVENSDRRDRFNEDASAKRGSREFGSRSSGGRADSSRDSRSNPKSSFKAGAKSGSRGGSKSASNGGPRRGGKKGLGGGNRSRGK